METRPNTSPVKRTTLSKRADSQTENHIPQVPGGGGEGRKPLLPMRTSFQKAHTMASQAPWCDKEMTISVERTKSWGRGGWRTRQAFFPREVELNSLNWNIDSSVSSVMTLTWWRSGLCQKPVGIKCVFNWKMAGKQGSRSLLEPGVHASMWVCRCLPANKREP